MIDLALAKKLKECGYPQEGDSGYYNATGLGISHGENDTYYTPNLSELIGALGELFERLIHIPKIDRGEWGGEWEAGVYLKPEDDECIYLCEQTPEEAVGRLWVELNK